MAIDLDRLSVLCDRIEEALGTEDAAEFRALIRAARPLAGVGLLEAFAAGVIVTDARATPETETASSPVPGGPVWRRKRIRYQIEALSNGRPPEPFRSAAAPVDLRR